MVVGVGQIHPWLAQEENLSLLGKAIGIELELESQEKEVRPFRADILYKDTATDNWVLIENQLERTDHSPPRPVAHLRRRSERSHRRLDYGHVVPEARLRDA